MPTRSTRYMMLLPYISPTWPKCTKVCYFFIIFVLRNGIWFQNLKHHLLPLSPSSFLTMMCVRVHRWTCHTPQNHHPTWLFSTHNTHFLYIIILIHFYHYFFKFQKPNVFIQSCAGLCIIYYIIISLSLSGTYFLRINNEDWRVKRVTVFLLEKKNESRKWTAKFNLWVGSLYLFFLCDWIRQILYNKGYCLLETEPNGKKTTIIFSFFFFFFWGQFGYKYVFSNWAEKLQD